MPSSRCSLLIQRPARLAAQATSLTLILLAAVGTACGKGPPPRDLGVDTSGLTLTDQTGQPFALESLREKQSVLLYFGFTHCPDFCPATLSKIKRVYRILGNRSRHVQTVLVSVDPERDTPERLARYLEYFEIDAVGLGGSPEEVASFAKRFAVHYSQQPLTANSSNAGAQPEQPGNRGAYTVDHYTGLFLIDTAGRVRHVFEHNDSPQLIAETLQLILPFF